MSTQPSGLIDDLSHYDCGVVLTGAPGRLREAFEILALKKLNKLIVSGVHKDVLLHEIFPHLPYYPEVNSDDIILEKISGSTLENARESLKVVTSLKCNSVLLITSVTHMYRARQIFKHIYFQKIEIADYAVPNIHKADYSFELLVETIKTIFYAFFISPIL